MDLWIHLMHRMVETHLPIDVHPYDNTYWTFVHNNCINTLQTPNIFIHVFLQDLLLERKIYSPVPFFPRKIVIWKQHVENPFYSAAQKDKMWNVYTRTQRAYFGFARLVRVWKLKHAKIQVDFDLYMNPITLTPKKSIQLYQDGAIYYFTIPNLISICNTSLMNSHGFFCEPLVPKNPYTNIPFSYTNMYLIYVAIRESNYRMSNLIHLYYLCDFNIQRFYFNHEATIRDEHISNFVKSASDEIVSTYIRQMLRKVKIKRRLFIDEDFPIDVLASTMRPFLKLYLIHGFSISNTEYRYRAYFELKYKLQKFVEFNPTYGRKISVRKPFCNILSRRHHYEEQFITHHISFYDIHIDENTNIYADKGVVDESESSDDELDESSDNELEVAEDESVS